MQSRVDRQIRALALAQLSATVIALAQKATRPSFEKGRSMAAVLGLLVAAGPTLVIIPDGVRSLRYSTTPTHRTPSLRPWQFNLVGRRQVADRSVGSSSGGPVPQAPARSDHHP